jgi:hypothetical protein
MRRKPIKFRRLDDFLEDYSPRAWSISRRSVFPSFRSIS